MELSERARAAVAENGRLAARLGMQVTDCPFSAVDPAERVAAAVWVRGFLAARPPMPDEVRHDQ